MARCSPVRLGSVPMAGPVYGWLGACLLITAATFPVPADAQRRLARALAGFVHCVDIDVVAALVFLGREMAHADHLPVERAWGDVGWR